LCSINCEQREKISHEQRQQREQKESLSSEGDGCVKAAIGGRNLDLRFSIVELKEPRHQVDQPVVAV
jgi:hypothetical protein